MGNNAEIKFRGKKFDTGEWVYGYYHLTIHSQTHCIDVPMADFDNSILWHVNPATVGQFTGLKDKEGREIYEGDIVRFKKEYQAELPSDAIFQIVFDEGAFCGENTDWKEYLGVLVDVGTVEVIGNVHEHPELLEVK